MVNTTSKHLVITYLAIVAATLGVLVVLSRLAPAQATPEAWGHAVVVGAFAVLLPLRMHAADRGSARAAVAVRVIAVVLLVVNVVEAALPGVFPVWMRLDMVVIAALMLVLVVSLARAGRPAARETAVR